MMRKKIEKHIGEPGGEGGGTNRFQRKSDGGKNSDWEDVPPKKRRERKRARELMCECV